jgi:hypothetical protein
VAAAAGAEWQWLHPLDSYLPDWQKVARSLQSELFQEFISDVF